MEKSFIYETSEVFYRIEGKGMPVVLLHGFGEDGNIWNYQTEFLKNHFKLIIPDLPGSGKSVGSWQLRIDTEKPLENQALPYTFQPTSPLINQSTNYPPSTIKYYADCIFALLQNENISQCIMIGHSMGGYITLAFAEKYPYLLKAFGLINLTAFADSEEKKENRKKGIHFIEQHGAYSFLKSTVMSLFGSSFKQNRPEKIKMLIEEGKKFSNESLQQYYTAMMNRPDRTNVLKNSRVPVLFVIGTEDTAAPLNDLLQQVHLPEISYIHMLKNVAHMSMWEASDKVNNYILEFANEVNDLFP